MLRVRILQFCLMMSGVSILRSSHGNWLTSLTPVFSKRGAVSRPICSRIRSLFSVVWFQCRTLNHRMSYLFYRFLRAHKSLWILATYVNFTIDLSKQNKIKMSKLRFVAGVLLTLGWLICIKFQEWSKIHLMLFACWWKVTKRWNIVTCQSI